MGREEKYSKAKLYNKQVTLCTISLRNKKELQVGLGWDTMTRKGVFKLAKRKEENH
jgi:hypothetical protein